MNGGLMDVLITVERPTYTDSEFSKATKPSGYSTLLTFWGRVNYNGGSEVTSANKKEFRQTVTITGHYVDTNTIAVTDRLSFDDTYWDIGSRAIVGRNQYIRMEAETVD